MRKVPDIVDVITACEAYSSGKYTKSMTAGRAVEIMHRAAAWWAFGGRKQAEHPADDAGPVTADLPKPATWWRENDTDTPVVVSCTAEVVDGGGTVVVYRRPLDGPPRVAPGAPTLAACNEPVPLKAVPVADFLARFAPTLSPMQQADREKGR